MSADANEKHGESSSQPESRSPGPQFVLPSVSQTHWEEENSDYHNQMLMAKLACSGATSPGALNKWIAARRRTLIKILKEGNHANTMPRLHPAAMLDPKAVRRLQRTLSQPFFHTWDQFPVIGTPQHYLRSHRHRPLSARAPTVGATSADGRSSAVQSAASVREPKEDASTEQGTVPIALHCMNSELQDYLEDSEWLRDLSWSENTSEASPPVPVRHFLRRAGLQASTSDGGGGSLASSAAATRARRRRVSSLGTAHDEDSAADLQDGEAWLSDESDPVLPPAPPALVYATNQAGERMVVWGTLAALIDELAPLQETDINYVQDFMITYEYVTTAPVLMERLLARYSFLPAEGLSQEQLTLHNSWRGPIRLKIINVLKFWMEVRFHDFQNDDNIFRLLVHFLNRIEHSGNERWANQLRLIVQKNVDKPLPQILVKNASPELLITAIRKSTTLFGTHKHKLRKIKNSFTGQELVQWLVNAQGLPHRQHAVVNATKLLETNLIEPIGTSSKRKFQDNKDLYVLKEVEGPPEVAVTYKKPLLPKHFEKSKTTYFTFMDLSSEEMARQLTLLEFSLLKKVTAPEIQSQNWTKNKKRAPNISAVIKHFNKMGQWVATEVLTTSVKENREAVIRKFIEIADHLREMQNYSTCLAIMSGLSHTSVSRLKRTWKSIPKKSRELLNDLYRLIRPDDNYASYRAALAASNPPVIPYLGLWLRDLTHIEDGMPSEDEHHRFNFHKLRLIGDIFLSIRACQENPYPFEEVEMIQKYLTTGLWVENEKALFQMSLKCEPREQTPSRSPSWRHSVFTKPKKKCGNSGNGSAGSDTCTASTSSLNETPDRMRKLTQVLGTELERGHPKKPPSRKSRSGQKRVSIAKTPEIREVPKSPSPLPRKQSGPTRTSSQKLRKFFGEATPAPPLASPAPLQSLSPPVGRREQRQASRSRRRSGSAISASSEMRVRALSPKTNRRSPLATASSSSGESSENSSIPTRSLPSSSASSYSGRDLSETDLSDDSSDAHSSSSSNHK
mmetsp:Transcript_13325/g.40213  ORF Transcript_13325/g.40213 Transcript_13325/m.40213 type:complete len:1021 (-) Transcript_13325:3162-6224(-)